MGCLSDLRDRREMERLAAGGDGDESRARLEEIFLRHPGDPRTAAFAALARSEAGDAAGALEAAERARPGLAPAAGSVLRAQVLLDAGREAEARTSLEEARRADPEGIAATALLAVLDLEGRGAQDPARAIRSLPPGALWCGPVLARLVLVLERAMEERARGGTAAGFHRARAVLIRPDLDGRSFPRFWIDRLGDLLDPLRPAEAREGRARRRDLARAFRAGDLRRAAAILDACLARKGPPDREVLLAIETAFQEERFEDVVRIRTAWVEGGGDAGDVYPAALAAYSLLARGEPARALDVLAPHRKDDRPEAAVLHLAAIGELELGRAARAAGLLRRAAGADDIALVRVAREEAEFLEGRPAP